MKRWQGRAVRNAESAGTLKMGNAGPVGTRNPRGSRNATCERGGKKKPKGEWA